MQITLTDNTWKDKWDQYIMDRPDGTFGHLHAWGNVYDLYGNRSFPLMAIDTNDNVRGVLRLFQRKDLMGRKFLISNPFLSYGGICADNDEIKKALFEKAREIAVAENVEYIEIRQLSSMFDGLPTKKDFVTMILSLERGDEFIWKKLLHASVRNKIRQAGKKGLTVDHGLHYFDDFYRVLATNHRDFGTPLHNKAFFRKILDEFRQSSGIFVAKHEDKVIAGMLYIHYKHVFSEPWASSLRKYNRLRPNNILYWEAIKHACKNGLRHFDFGRSTIDCGTYNFKKQWGAEPVQLNYQYILNRARRIPQVNAHDNKYQVAINIWKRLPLFAANFVGNRVIRYLPEL